MSDAMRNLPGKKGFATPRQPKEKPTPHPYHLTETRFVRTEEQTTRISRPQVTDHPRRSHPHQAQPPPPPHPQPSKKTNCPLDLPPPKPRCFGATRCFSGDNVGVSVMLSESLTSSSLTSGLIGLKTSSGVASCANGSGSLWLLGNCF